MLITELGAATTILIGASIGFGGFAILLPCIQIFWKSFGADSKCFWPVFWGHMIFWTVGTCVVSADWLNETIGLWGKPVLIIGMVLLVVMAITKISKLK